MPSHFGLELFSPGSPDQLYSPASSGPSQASSSGALITPSDELPELSYHEAPKAQPNLRTAIYDANEDKHEITGRVFRTTALDALEEDIYLRRQKSSAGNIHVYDYTSPSSSSSRHYTRSLREREVSAPTPPPKDLYLDPSNLRSPASQYSPMPTHAPNGNHRRTLSARELIKVFDHADAQLLPSDNDFPRRATVSQSARSNNKPTRSSPVSPIPTRPHSSYAAKTPPIPTAAPREPPVSNPTIVASPRTPPKQTRLLSPLSFTSPRQKSKPLDKLSIGGTTSTTNGSSSSLNSMMAAVLAPSSSSGSGGMGASVKNGFQSLLGVFSPAARRRKKRSTEHLDDLAEEGFVVDRSGRGISLRVSSVCCSLSDTSNVCEVER